MSRTKLRQSQRRWCRLVHGLRAKTLSMRGMAVRLHVATDTVAGVIRGDKVTRFGPEAVAAIAANHALRSRTYSIAQMAKILRVDAKTVRRAIHPELAARLDFQSKVYRALGPRQHPVISEAWS